MRVIISVSGKFHAFRLAYQLYKNNALTRIITSYPIYEVKKYGIPKQKVVSILLKEIIERGWAVLPSYLKVCNPQFYISELFDNVASKKLLPSDIFVGWSGCSLHTLQEAKKKEITTIVERGSSHILYQKNILQEEYELLGIRSKCTVHPKILEKSLAEYEEADYIGIPSLFAKRSFIQMGISEKKLMHIPYGVDTSLFRKVAKNDAIFRVVFVGNISIQKGVHYLLKAFSSLHLKNAELLLIGPCFEDMRPYLRRHNKDVRWVSHVANKDLYKYYSQGSVFAIPSIQEGLALVIAEAMACGLPVIATTNTGAEDIVRDGIDGFIIPIRDINALQEKIMYCYNNPEQAHVMGLSGQARVSREFTWDHYGQRIVETYTKICAKSL